MIHLLITLLFGSPITMTRETLISSRTRMPDAAYLIDVANTHNIPAEIFLSMAWQESHGNLNPNLRGASCRARTLPLKVRQDCEVGRFQIRRPTALRRCPGLDRWKYESNVACAAKMMAEDIARWGVSEAVRRHNGTGPQARGYSQQVRARAYDYLTDPALSPFLDTVSK